jgi:hypothetical protein
MVRHVNLLSVLFLIWGALALVAGLAILVLAVGALAILTSAHRAEPGADLAAGLTVGMFFLIAIGALIWGGTHVLTGSALRRNRHWARLTGMGLAVPNLFFLPFGTGLAVYTFWTLLNEDARQLFTQDTPPAPAPEPPAAG